MGPVRLSPADVFHWLFMVATATVAPAGIELGGVVMGVKKRRPASPKLWRSGALAWATALASPPRRTSSASARGRCSAGLMFKRRLPRSRKSSRRDLPGFFGPLVR